MRRGKVFAPLSVHVGSLALSTNREGCLTAYEERRTSVDMTTYFLN